MPGSIVGIIGIGYVVLEYIPSIEPPANMRFVTAQLFASTWLTNLTAMLMLDGAPNKSKPSISTRMAVEESPGRQKPNVAPTNTTLSATVTIKASAGYCDILVRMCYPSRSVKMVGWVFAASIFCTNQMIFGYHGKK